MSIAQPRIGLASPERSHNPPSLAGVRALAAWNFGHLLYAMVLSLVPQAFGPTYSLYKFLILSLFLCAMVTISKLRVPLRLCAPVIAIMLLQVWFTFCAFHASVTLGRTKEWSYPDFFLILYIGYFANSALLAYYAPHYRRIFLNLLLGVICIHAFVALLQFAHFGPAVSLGQAYNTTKTIESWDNRGGIRAVGLTGWPDQMALYAVIASAILSARLLHRRLKLWEIGLAVFFIGVGFMAQSRTMIPVVVGAMIVFAVMMARREGERAIFYISALVASLIGMFYVAYERLAYTLGTNIRNDPNLNYRLHYGWPLAQRIIEARPFTGVGPDKDLVFMTGAGLDRWAQGITLDSGYLILLTWGGIPALLLFLAAAVMALRETFKLVRRKLIDPVRRELAFVATVAILAELWNMGLDKAIHNPSSNMFLFAIGGLLMASELELRGESRTPQPV